MHGIGPASQAKLSNGFKLRKKIWEGTGQRLHSNTRDIQELLTWEVAIDSKG
jgi:hypothetical protein